MSLYEIVRKMPGVQLRLQAGDAAVERAVAAYERQYRTQATRSGPNIFVTLFAPRGLGVQHFSVPDQLREVKFEWLVVLREELQSYQTSSARDAPNGLVVLIPHSGGESLRPFGRERGTASFSGRQLTVERVATMPSQSNLRPGVCVVNIQTLAVSLRPHFRHSREEREECNLPRESPVGFEPKVDDGGSKGVTIHLDLTREGGLEQMVQPTNQGAFSSTVGWADLSAPRRAALHKLLCGEHLEDYRLDSQERWRRFNDRMGQSEWVIPADTSAWRAANQDKPRWQWGPEPREQRCPAQKGLDGFPTRRGKQCGHLHFAAGVDPSHEERQEEDGDGYGQSRWEDDDRW